MSLMTTCDNCGRDALCDWVPETAKAELPHWRTTMVACSTCMRQCAAESSLYNGFMEAQQPSALDRARSLVVALWAWLVAPR